MPCSIDTCACPEQLGCFQISSCANSTVMNNFICILSLLHYIGWDPAIKMTGSKGYEDLTDFHFWDIWDIWFSQNVDWYRVWFNIHLTEWDSSYYIIVFCKFIFLLLCICKIERSVYPSKQYLLLFSVLSSEGGTLFTITQHWNLRLISMVDWIWGWRNERNKKIV